MIQCDLVPIRQLLIGDLQPFGPHGEPSGIDKQPVSGALTAGPTGLAGDRQADLRHHGGPDKAIHHYPAEHYLAWQATGLPLDPARLQPGGFGENISTTGLTEQTVCIGDVFRAGSIVLQVAQARQPCWKLGIRFVTCTSTSCWLHKRKRGVCGRTWKSTSRRSTSPRRPRGP